MLCPISRKLKRSEQLQFGCKIAASAKLPYEADTDTVAVAYCAPKTVWEQWMKITCFASYSAGLRLLFIFQRYHYSSRYDRRHRATEDDINDTNNNVRSNFIIQWMDYYRWW
jgi:hypothetical protein